MPAPMPTRTHIVTCGTRIGTVNGPSNDTVEHTVGAWQPWALGHAAALEPASLGRQVLDRYEI
jgi:hypothetical protein